MITPTAFVLALATFASAAPIPQVTDCTAPSAQLTTNVANLTRVVVRPLALFAACQTDRQKSGTQTAYRGPTNFGLVRSGDSPTFVFEVEVYNEGETWWLGAPEVVVSVSAPSTPFDHPPPRLYANGSAISLEYPLLLLSKRPSRLRRHMCC